MSAQIAYFFHQRPSDIIDPHYELSDYERFIFDIGAINYINDELSGHNKKQKKSKYIKSKIQELKEVNRNSRS